MSKRSSFPRIPKDLYRTWDKRALPPLLAHLPPGASFFEPCAGQADLINQLSAAGHECVGAIDLSPTNDNSVAKYSGRYGEMTVAQGDATKWRLSKHFDTNIDFIITNPPWTRETLHAIILNLYWQRPCWMLFDAGWAHTEQARPYLPMCRKIVSTPRLKWFEGTRDAAIEDTAWHLFEPAGYPEFRGRI